MLSFAHLWQQTELSDVDVLLVAPSSTDQNGNVPPQKLAEFPGHTVLLSSSPYLKALILRWQHKRPHEQTVGVSTRSMTAAGSSSSSAQQAQQAPSRPQLVLTLQDASEQQAATAVLAALYGAKPMPELLSELSQEQQLQAAMLVDMWQLPTISTQAADALAQTLRAQGKLSDAATKQLFSLTAVPDCLKPLLQQVLLLVLGNLEECWANKPLLDMLVGLPLSSMEVLLSCSELKVASEDTVLYTVQECMDIADDAATKQRIQERLGPLIRCQHLSRYWLLLAAFSEDADAMPVAQLRPQLKQLVLMRSATASVPASVLKDRLADVPPSWLLGKRTVTPIKEVQLTWELNVGELRDAARRCAAERKLVGLGCPGVTPPLGGIDFRLSALCALEDDSDAVSICMSVAPSFGRIPSDAWCSFTFELSAPQLDSFDTTVPLVLRKKAYSGCNDFFEVGPMAGGWDQAVWASKGLPATGTLPVKLTVSKVGHMANTAR